MYIYIYMCIYIYIWRLPICLLIRKIVKTPSTSTLGNTRALGPGGPSPGPSPRPSPGPWALPWAVPWGPTGALGRPGALRGSGPVGAPTSK